MLTTCAYGVLIKEPLLSDYEMINVHPSLLPRWRGAAPIERSIMAGDAETGVAIMHVTAGWDSGAVYALGREPIHADDDYGTLAPRLEQLGARLLVEVLDERPTPQSSRTSPRSPTRTRSVRASVPWTRRRRRSRSSARSARCARTSAPGSRCPTARSSA